MKYIIVLGDGMADYPIDEIGGKTPLEYADTPMMDALAEKSDQPITKEIDRKTLLNWLETKISMSQIKALGYEIEEYSLMERNGFFHVQNQSSILATKINFVKAKRLTNFSIKKLLLY